MSQVAEAIQHIESQDGRIEATHLVFISMLNEVLLSRTRECERLKARAEKAEAELLRLRGAKEQAA